MVFMIIDDNVSTVNKTFTARVIFVNQTFLNQTLNNSDT